MSRDPHDPPVSSTRVRDHLANERTFLAWVRTALGLIGLGFVLARMGVFLRQLVVTAEPGVRHQFRGSHEFMATGIVFLILGTVLSAWSGWLYRRTCKAIEAERYEPPHNTIMVMTVIVVAGGLGIVGLVVWQLLGSDGP